LKGIVEAEAFPAPAAAALFGPGVVSVEEVRWSATSGARGRFWTAVSPDGVFWVSDGEDRMAALPKRALRFLRSGIASRCNGLVDRYLKGIVPVGEGDTVVNFGANIGEVAVTLAKRGARVIAIEPDPNILPFLAANAEGKRIEIAPVAAWYLDGDVEVHIATDTADTSVFEPKPGRSTSRMSLPCRTIDGIVADRGIDRVRLIVGDAEGAEPEVLAGAFATLAMTDYVSISCSDERCGQTTIDTCERILWNSGFETVHRESTKFCILIGKNRRSE
jgi:FkbM family methyltransferase